MSYRTINLKRTNLPLGLLGLVLISLALLLFQFGPLKGSLVALVLSAGLQVGLTGYVVARTLGLGTSPEPLTRLVTIVACGLMPLIVVGALFRLLGIGLPVFIVTVHLVLLILCLFPAPARTPRLQMTRQTVGAYLTVGICVVVLECFGVAQTQYRFAAEFSDRALFASLTEWLVSDGDASGRYNRIVGQVSEFRLELDGWTYASSAWVYGSGVPAYAYVWYLQTPLLVWIIPVALFVLAYQLTRSHWAAAATVIALTIIALQTFDTRIYESFVILGGRHPVLDLRTVREVSLGVLLPLALFGWVSYLRARQSRWLFLVGVSLVALAVVHPRADLVFILLLAVSGGVALLSRRLKVSKWAILGFAVIILLGGLAGVFFLHTRLPELFAPQSSICTASNLPPIDMVSVSVFELGGLGLTYILVPNIPASLVILACSLYLAIVYRRRFAGGLFLAPAVILVAVLLSPPLIQFVSRLLSRNLLVGDPCQLNNIFVTNLIENLVAASGINAVTPVLLGCTVWTLLRGWPWLKRYTSVVFPVAITGFLLLTVFEPIPIPDSARDQLRTREDSVSHLAVMPVDVHFADDIQRFMNPDQVQIILAPPEVAGTIIEQIPNTLVVTQAAGIYQMQANRFYTTGVPAAPFLDAFDIAFLRETQVGYVIMRVFDTRYPQLLLDADRFEPLYTAYGYALFRVKGLGEPNDADRLYEQLNQVFMQQYASAWDHTSLTEFPFAPASIPQTLIDAWDSLPAAPLTTYGQAFLNMLRGDFAAALPLWESLADRSPMLVEARALSLNDTGHEDSAVNALLDVLTMPDTGAALLAARALLSERYLYRLSSDDIAQILAVISEHEWDWRQLTRQDFSGLNQQRIELLMARGFWETAAKWLDWIPKLEIRADEYAMRGMALLAQGDVTAALSHLARATDPDWLQPRTSLHPDRWADNVAAQVYDVLSGNLAERDGLKPQAEAFYRRAIADGAAWAGRYFLARLRGDAQAMANLENEWQAAYATPMPEMVSLLTVAETGAIYVNQPAIVRGDSERAFQVYTTFGMAFERLYPVARWRADVRSPDSQEIYAQTDVDAHFVVGALLRLPIAVQVDPEVLPLTPAIAHLQARHNAAVLQGDAQVPVTLQRPSAAMLPNDATDSGAEFGSVMSLVSYRMTVRPDEVEAVLYWNAAQSIMSDYQISVQVLDANNVVIRQYDSAPLDNRYPTSQWRSNTLIEDRVAVRLPDAMSPGQYHVMLVVYSPADGVRLSASGDGGSDGALLLGTFDR